MLLADTAKILFRQHRSNSDLSPCLRHDRFTRERWGNRPASLWIAEDLGAALQADGETRSVVTASSIRRRSAAWTILLDWTFRSMRRVFALWMTWAGSYGK